MAVVEGLLLAGVSIDSVTTESGFSLCHSAIVDAADDGEILGFLLGHNANLTLPDKNGRTPIELACHLKRWDIVTTIAMRRNTDSDDKAHYCRALHAALIANQTRVMRELLVAATPIDYPILSDALSNHNDEARELLQQYVANWSEAVKSELFAKYNFLRSLQDKMLTQKWTNEDDKVSFFHSALHFFATSARNDIQQLQLKLSALPASITCLEQDWSLIETLFLECHPIVDRLRANQKPNQHIASQQNTTGDYFHEVLASYQSLNQAYQRDKAREYRPL